MFTPPQGLAKAVCDVTTDGQLWAVIQSRAVGDVLFNRTYSDYRNGFGDVTGDYWIGLDAIRELCPAPTNHSYCQVN